MARARQELKPEVVNICKMGNRRTLFGLTLALVAYLAWLQLPLPLSPGRMADLCSRRQAQWEADQQLYGQDTVTNIYLRRDSPYPGTSRDLKILHDLARFSPHRGPEFSARKLLNLGGDFAGSLDDFRRRFGALLRERESETLACQVFVVPSGGIGLDDKAFENISEVCEGFYSFSQHLLARGKVEEAASLGLNGLCLSRQVGQRPNSLRQHLAALSLQTSFRNSLLASLRGGQRLPISTLRLLQRGAGLYQISQQSGQAALECEILRFHDGLRRLRGDSGPVAMLYHWGGLADRDQRIADNAALRILDQLPEAAPAVAQTPVQAVGQMLAAALPEQNIYWGFLSGRRGVLTLPDLHEWQALCRVNETGNQALAIMASLEIYRGQKGQYPTNLEAVREAGLPQLPEPALGGHFDYARQNERPTLTLRVSPEVAGAAGLTQDTDPPYREGAICYCSGLSPVEAPPVAFRDPRPTPTPVPTRKPIRPTPTSGSPRPTPTAAMTPPPKPVRPVLDPGGAYPVAPPKKTPAPPRPRPGEPEQLTLFPPEGARLVGSEPVMKLAWEGTSPDSFLQVMAGGRSIYKGYVKGHSKVLKIAPNAYYTWSVTQEGRTQTHHFQYSDQIAFHYDGARGSNGSSDPVRPGDGGPGRPGQDVNVYLRRVGELIEFRIDSKTPAQFLLMPNSAPLLLTARGGDGGDGGNSSAGPPGNGGDGGPGGHVVVHNGLVGQVLQLRIQVAGGSPGRGGRGNSPMPGRDGRPGPPGTAMEARPR